MSDNFNKFCGVLILLLLGLSTLFTLRASAEDYTPPADVAETTEEETHEVIQVQGVQTYDPQLYEKLDTLQESINTLVDVLTPAEDAADVSDTQTAEPAPDYTAQLDTISEQLVPVSTCSISQVSRTSLTCWTGSAVWCRIGRLLSRLHTAMQSTPRSRVSSIRKSSSIPAIGKTFGPESC